MNHFPLFADLRGRPVLLVGGGAVAARKAESLLKAGARVRVAAAELGAAMTAFHQAGCVEWSARTFDDALLDGVFLAVAATGDTALNRRVFAAAEARQKPVNTVDDASLCSFIFPAMIDRGDIQIAVSSGGKAPVLARLVREKLEALLPQGLGVMADLAGRWRSRVKQRLDSITQRRRFWEKLFADADFRRLCENSRTGEAETLLARSLDAGVTRRGSVALVGAGPGDAGLLTLKGLQKIQAADVVLYDALVSDGVLELIRRDAEKIFVGKRAGGKRVAQEETNALLVRLAQEGKRVVRLKGGDPFVFGRGGEELETLAAAGIAFEVVPGITAALGATAYAGIPLTHRDHAQSAMFVTGHVQPDGKALNWKTLAQGRQTLVVYMGAIRAAELAAALLEHGRSPDTPAAVISRGTQPQQRVSTGTLANLPALAAAAESPALIVIGETVALRRKLDWFGKTAERKPHRFRQEYFYAAPATVDDTCTAAAGL
ncbi:Siroheme synthase [Kingella potus]|uniref:Siroheme synthase n=1 Tax=Kingella potus TaxID=265175 RepID=A0A377R5V6_9NEIS|nr:siroheme synthase CysG [Kingella potus]STR03362.1 Siroheme synthase [Kingella potus]